MIKKLSFILFAALLGITPLVSIQSSKQYENRLVQVEKKDLYKTLEHVAVKKLGMDPNVIDIKQHKNQKDLAESGRAGTIFFIQNRLELNLAVLKVFHLKSPNERVDFQKEKETLEALAKLPLNRFHYAEMLAYGEYEAGGEKIGILAEKAAPGKSLNSLIRTLANTPKYSLDRERLYMEVREAVQDTAEALAELHSVKHFSKGSNHLESYYKDLARKHGVIGVKNLPGPFGYIHGDTHPGNIFYSQIRNGVTFIDMANGECSSQGGPIGADLGRFLVSFEMLASFYHLPSDEITSLKDNFLKRYQETGPKISQGAIDFYYDLNLMEFHDSFAKRDTHKNKQAKHIYTFTAKKMADHQIA